jgi:hypothetical protein
MIRKVISKRNKEGTATNVASFKGKGIFRKQGIATAPKSIQPSLTISLSEDEAEVVTKRTPKVQQITSFIFTEEELKVNELNHLRELVKKQEEIVKLREVYRELKQLLVLKDEKLFQARGRIAIKDAELANLHKYLSMVETELFKSKLMVLETKDTLSTLGSTLIQTQHKLYQAKKSWLW